MTHNEHISVSSQPDDKKEKSISEHGENVMNNDIPNTTNEEIGSFSHEKHEEEEGDHHHAGSASADEIHLAPEILQSFYHEPTPEAQLEKVLEFMQISLNQGGAHHFRDFWEARKCALVIFKETIHASARVHLWAKYTDLCREARRLKETFDEQSAFLAEQIEIAIQAVEDELKFLPEKLLQAQEIEEFSQAYAIRENVHEYSQIQGELNYLNAFATRLTSLKKELVKAEIRLKVKNKLFQHLAHVGDILFPRRKELIHLVSEMFKRDVENFIQNAFMSDVKTPELFEIREEVKRLQHIAKILTLNTEVFSLTREELSQCWDTIRDVVKERKKAHNEHRHLMRQHRDEILEEIHTLKSAFHAKEIDPLQASKLLKGVQVKMRAITLAHNDVQFLKGEMRSFDNEVRSALDREKEERHERLVQADQEKNRKIDQIRDGIVETIEKYQLSSKEISILSENEILECQAALESYEQQVDGLKRSKTETSSLFSLLSQAKQSLSRVAHRKRLQQAFSGSGKDYNTALQALAEERAGIKAELDRLRKTRGLSGNDITQAMLLNEQIEELKNRLDEVDQSIQDIHRQG